jgi:hypothetical protein
MDKVGPICYVPNGNLFGVWYAFEVEEDVDVVVHLCNEVTNFDSWLTVFEGSCDGLVRIVDNDDGESYADCGIRSALGWLAKADTVYHILVSFLIRYL